MAQDPLLVDQISIEPGSTGTRLINRASDGSIQFTDPVVGTKTLSAIAGLGSITGVMVVGQTGKYIAIQTAIDAVPVSSSVTNPYLVLVMPGVYTEDVTIYRDGVFLVGLGGVTIQSALESTPDAVGADHTVTIKADLGSIPKKVVIENVRITNAHQNKACVYLEGGAASTVGSTSILLKDLELVSSSASGNRPIKAVSINNLKMQGGSCAGSHALSLLTVEECASAVFEGVSDLTAMQLDYDTGGTLPSVTGSVYELRQCANVANASALATPFSSTLLGAGSLALIGCSNVSDVSVGGNNVVNISNSSIGDLVILDTVSVTVLSSWKGAVTAAPGASLEEPIQRGAVAFAAVTAVTVTFAVQQTDDSYSISVEVDDRPVGDETPWITSKSVTGFDINFFSAQTLNAYWTLSRVMGGSTN